MMKPRLLIPLLIFMANFGLKSQTYCPFPTDNACWNIRLISMCSIVFPPDTSLLRYALHGDTIINAISYHKLCLETEGFTSPKIVGIGGIREQDQKIYFSGQAYLGNIDPEILLYDFTRQIGEAIGDWPSWIIESIDNILIDGQYRKRFKTVNPTWGNAKPDYIVEGIGSISHGLLQTLMPIPTCGGRTTDHVCYHQDGNVLYLNPMFVQCFSTKTITGIDNIAPNSPVTIFFDAQTNQLQIINQNQTEDLAVRIVDFSGRTLTQQLITRYQTTLSLPNIIGIYNVLVVNSNGKIVYSQKVLNHSSQ